MNCPILQIVCVGIVSFAHFQVSAGPGDWRFSNPKPHGNNLIDMAYKDGVVWQVGDRGSLYLSPDLDNWFPQQTPTTASLRGITFFGNRVFISGSEGTILSGEKPWQLQLKSVGTTAWLEGIAASDSAVVAVADNGAIYRSSDGINWARQGNFTTPLTSITWGSNRFVCVGRNGFVAVSSNGADWNQRTSGTSRNLNEVEFINGQFYMVGDGGTVLASPDLQQFTAMNVGVTNNLFAIAGGARELLVAGDQAVYTRSYTGGSWVSQADASSTNLAPLWPYYSALWDGRLFLLGGRTGLKVEGYRSTPSGSLRWYSSVQPTRRWLWSVMRAGDTLYAASGNEGTILTSLDGVDWDREVVPSEALSEILLGIGGTTNTLVSVGSGGVILYSTNIVQSSVSTNQNGQTTTNYSSLLGVHWNAVTPRPTTRNLQGVAANQNTFVAVGAQGTILTSGNGMLWLQRPSPVSSYLSSVSAWPGGFVASGDLGKIVTSTDGGLWIPQNSGVTNWIYAVRHVGSKLIAVGEEGLILTSDNGVNWTRRNSGTTQWLNDVTYSNGKWFIAANAGYILSSSDAVNWEISSSASAKTLNSIVAYQGMLIAAGTEGVILRRRLVPHSAPVEIDSFATVEGTSVFLFTGELDQRFTIEEKENLGGNWMTGAQLEITDPSGTLIYEHPNGSKPVKFFRTRSIP